jgi:cytochrome c-type biogenesis protein CcmH/NrfF
MNGTIFFMVAASLLIGFCGGYLIGVKDQTPSSRRIPMAGMSQGSLSQPASLTLDSKSAEIAKRLNCVCGCKMELMTCTCEDARGSKEIKLFVQDRVRQDLPESKIVNQLIDKYGEGILIKRSDFK